MDASTSQFHETCIRVCLPIHRCRATSIATCIMKSRNRCMHRHVFHCVWGPLYSFGAILCFLDFLFCVSPSCASSLSLLHDFSLISGSYFLETFKNNHRIAHKSSVKILCFVIFMHYANFAGRIIVQYIIAILLLSNLNS